MREGETCFNAAGDVLCNRLLLADSFFAKARGLLGRPPLEEGVGLLIKGCASVHTFFMTYPIHLIYLDKDDRILKIVHSLSPWRVSACKNAASVLELNAEYSLLPLEKYDILQFKNSAF